MILTGNALEILPTLDAKSVHCCVTSPPYWGLRDYGVAGQLGLEPNPEEYVMKMVEVFSLVYRVLRNDGTLWLNLGDTYTSGNRTHRRDADSKNLAALQTFDRIGTPPGLKSKDLIGIPWRLAFALQADGWWLRSACPWIKKNCMPESCKDRPTTAVEYVFLLSKSEHYFYDHEAIKITASTDTHARYARGRSDSHKYADGGPGGQTIAKTFNHMAGVNPKAALGIVGREKQNPSFSAACKDIVGTRARRNSDWFFESFQGLLQDEGGNPLAFIVNSRGFKGAHFATFPEKLVEPCIKAGTSEKGCCPECGSPWERIIERTGHENKREPAHQPGNSPTKTDSTGWAPLMRATNDWRPICTHNLDPIPCTVLDPFSGAGTTGLVAEKL